MGHTKGDVVVATLRLLDDYGLPALSMRRLAATLGVQQSALYWHFESKQVLLAAVAEEILERGAWSSTRTHGSWDVDVTRSAAALRDTLLAYHDGAELVSTVYAFGLGAAGPHHRFSSIVESAGAGPADADAAATVLYHFVLGFVFSEQQQLHASSAGAIGGPRPPGWGPRPSGEPRPFDAGVAMIVDGIRARLGRRVET